MMKELNSLAFMIFLWLTCSTLQGQHFPSDLPVFSDTEITRIDILIHPDSLAAILDDLENEYEYRATFVFTGSTLQDTLADIGFRLRGNTSLFSAKKSFKVSFNTWVPGRKYYGLEKMNLNGEHNDPCIMRSKTWWDLCRASGIPGPRSSHVKLYINGDYYGLYMNVEHIDDALVKSRFGNNDGNLYKCLWPADLTYLGDDPDLYKFMSGDHRAYELHINEDIDDYSDLAHFIAVLNLTPDNALIPALDSVFNIQSWLRFLALECLTGHWDSYSLNKNNYYLYHNDATGKFEHIPYDVDNTFGIDWFNIDWARRNIYNWTPGEARPLTDRLLDNELCRKEFSFYVDQLLRELYHTSRMYPRIDSLYYLIYDAAADDPYRPLDYGWSMQDFHDAFIQALGGHVKYGLKPFIYTRHQSAMQQLDLPSGLPKLRINEFMASNDGVIADEHGDYDDWIELYNADSSPVWLGDLYLTDNLCQPDKWQLPPLDLPAGGYLLLWADGETQQGNVHANFKLSAEGEHIGIFTSPADGSDPVDILTYGNQPTDQSSGLLPNGQGLARLLTFPSPGSSNSGNIGLEETESPADLLVFPNPFIQDINLVTGTDMTWMRIRCFDILGQEIYQTGIRGHHDLVKCSLAGLAAGVYFLEVQAGTAHGGEIRFPLKKVVKQ